MSTTFLTSAPHIGKWHSTKAMDWAAVSPDLSDAEYRFYSVCRSLLTKNGNVRKLTLGELCMLLPSREGDSRSSSQSKVRRLLLSLGKKGLVTDPQGGIISTSSKESGLAKEISLMVSDFPMNPAQYSGWRNTYDALDALRGRVRKATHDNVGQSDSSHNNVSRDAVPEDGNSDITDESMPLGVQNWTPDPSEGSELNPLGSEVNPLGSDLTPPPGSDQGISHPSFSSSSSPYLGGSAPAPDGEDEEEIDFVEEQQNPSVRLSQALAEVGSSPETQKPSEDAYAFVDAIPWPRYKAPSVSERDELAYEVGIRLPGWDVRELRGRLDAKCQWGKLTFPVSVALGWLRDFPLELNKGQAAGLSAEQCVRRDALRLSRAQQEADIAVCTECNEEGYTEAWSWHNKQYFKDVQWCGHGKESWKNDLWALENPEKAANVAVRAGCTNRAHREAGVDPVTGVCVVCQAHRDIPAQQTSGDSEGARFRAQIRARKTK